MSSVNDSAGNRESHASGGLRVVLAALIINVLIAASKFVAAFFSRSTAMLAEACHSLADTVNQIFLLIGARKAARPPDEKHPFGHGPETYFWAFMVALSIFALGAGFSVHEGVEKILHREHKELGDPRSAYVVLGVSIVLEGFSLFTAMRELKQIRAGRTLRRTLAESRDPTVLTVLFEDVAALFGLVIALGGILLTHATGDVLWDGIASILVGLALGVVSIVLARDSKSLLIGRSVTEADTDLITRTVRAHASVLEIIHLRAVHLGPEEVMAAIKIRFVADMDVRTLENKINEIEAQLRLALPRLRRIYIEPGFDERASRADLG